jgi:hypothetical protein
VIGAVNITNPPAGPQTLVVSTSADTTPAQNTTPYIITAAAGSQVTAVSATTAPTTAGAMAAYTVGFHATTALVGGTGTITLNGQGSTTSRRPRRTTPLTERLSQLLRRVVEQP